MTTQNREKKQRSVLECTSYCLYLTAPSLTTTYPFLLQKNAYTLKSRCKNELDDEIQCCSALHRLPEETCMYRDSQYFSVVKSCVRSASSLFRLRLDTTDYYKTTL